MFYFTKHSLKQIYTNFWVHCLLLFFGKGGLLRHGFCSNWHCGPAKFLGQLHWLGEIQIPLFWHGITHIATKQIKFKLTFQNSKKKEKNHLFTFTSGNCTPFRSLNFPFLVLA